MALGSDPGPFADVGARLTAARLPDFLPIEFDAIRAEVYLAAGDPRAAYDAAMAPSGPVPLLGYAARSKILVHVVAGLSYGEIARDLFISEKTVSSHISNLLRKTGASNRVDLARLAMSRVTAYCVFSSIPAPETPRFRGMPSPFVLSAEVADAIAARRPVVALESTIISHGLPRPRNHEAALEFEAILRDASVTPATIAVLDGVPRIGLDADGLRRIADEDLAKASVRDLPIIAAGGLSAATTVAATSHLASLAGIRVFATGGLGGVHRGASSTFDESADLTTLAVTPVTVVSAGVKSVLDIAATLERLETLSVPVVGFGTTIFPSFWLRESAFTLDWSVDDAAQVAAIMRSHDELGHGQGIVVANPIPLHEQWDPAEHDRILAEALALADAAGVTGKAVTPFLLLKIVELSGGRSLEVNLDLARNNVRVAGRIATEWAALNG